MISYNASYSDHIYHLPDRLEVEDCFCIAPYFVDKVSAVGVAAVVAPVSASAAACLSALFALASASYSSSSSTFSLTEAPRAANGAREIMTALSRG